MEKIKLIDLNLNAYRLVAETIERRVYNIDDLFAAHLFKEQPTWFLNAREKRLQAITELEIPGHILPTHFIYHKNSFRGHLEPWGSNIDIATYLKNKSLSTKVKHLNIVSDSIKKAHQKGFVHTDLDASNIVVSADIPWIRDINTSVIVKEGIRRAKYFYYDRIGYGFSDEEDDKYDLMDLSIDILFTKPFQSKDIHKYDLDKQAFEGLSRYSKYFCKKKEPLLYAGDCFGNIKGDQQFINYKSS